MNSFKNFERLRYRISNDMERLLGDKESKSDDIKKELSNTIFATVFSAFITEIAFSDNVTEFGIKNIVLNITIFVIVYVVSYWGYNKSVEKISQYILQRRIHETAPTMRDSIEIQKDFDNIACDSIIVAKEFQEEFIASENNLKKFYYFEVLHYIETASEKTQKLVENRNCIRSADNEFGVDIFRIRNAVKLMEESVEFLKENFENVCKNDKEEELIDFRLKQVCRLIEEISII